MVGSNSTYGLIPTAANSRYMQNMPSAIMAPWVRLMTSITPQIRLKPIAASPYTAPTSRPSIMEASTPDISHPPSSWLSTSILVAPASFDFAQDKPCRLSRGHLALAGGGGTPPRQPPGRRRYVISVDRIHQVGALARQWPHNFFYRFARLIFLPLREDHGMAHLQAVFVGGGREFGPPVKGRDIGGVQRLRHLGRVNPARLFDGTLQDHSAPVATGGLDRKS